MKEKIKNILTKIDARIGNIRLDFTLHVIASVVILWVATSFFGLCGCDLVQSTLLGTVLTLAIGVIKETVIDTLIKDSMPDQRDVIADVCGTCLGLVLMISGALIF